jgi:hypothetical protein
MSFTAIQSCQGITLQWGSTRIGVTRLSYSRSSPSEIDVSSFQSNQFTDPDNTNRRVLIKDVDYAICDKGEITCDFFGAGSFGIDQLGMMKPISIAGLNNGPSGQAYLTQISTEVVAGDLVRGTCTFKLTNFN